MRHDDSSKRPEVDRALAPPRSAPRARADDAGEHYEPGDDDVEMIEQAELSSEAEEIIPSDSELELSDVSDDGSDAYDANAGSETGLASAEGDLFGPGGALAGLGGPLFDAGEDSADGALSGELIVEPWADRPSEARVPVSIRPGVARMSAPPLPPPPAVPDEGSPWATDAAASIDAEALPSSHLPFAQPEEKEPPKPAPVPAEAAGGSRSWLTIFLAIVLLAGGATFLVLLLKSGQKPQEPQNTGAPIAVPTGAKPADVPPPTQPTTALAPSQDPALLAPSASVAAPETPPEVPSGAAEPDSSAVSVPTVMVTSSPLGPSTGTSKAPVGPRQPSKKPSRIF